MAEGGELWHNLEAFELRLLARTPTAETAAQAEKVRGVYKRRLGLPLLDMEGAYSRYVVWEASAQPAADEKSKADLKRSYDGALKEMRKRRNLENRCAWRERG